MIGYTISSLDSNESILEKLTKIEKYLTDNKICNIYLASTPVDTNYFHLSNIVNSGLNTVSAGDLILSSDRKVYTIESVSSNMAYVDTNTVIDFSDTKISSIVVDNPTPTTAQIIITDSNGDTYTSNNFTVGSGGGGAGIQQIALNNPTPATGEIVITDTDNNTYTSNTFGINTAIDTMTLSDDNGDTTKLKLTILDTSGVVHSSNVHSILNDVYIVNTDAIESKLGYDYMNNSPTTSSKSIVLGYNARNFGCNNIIVLGKDAQAQNNHTITIGDDAISYQEFCISIGDSAESGGTGSDKYCIAIGYGAQAQKYGSIAIGGDIDNLNRTQATAEHTIAIGYASKATAFGAVQIGDGTNNKQDTFNVFNNRILDCDNSEFFFGAKLMAKTPIMGVMSGFNNFATQLASGQFYVSSDDQQTTYPIFAYSNITDMSELEYCQLLCVYIYEDTNAGTTETTLCQVAFEDYDSVTQTCKCSIALQLAQSFTV